VIATGYPAQRHQGGDHGEPVTAARFHSAGATTMATPILVTGAAGRVGGIGGGGVSVQDRMAFAGEAFVGR
jgi:hypothetical protein